MDEVERLIKKLRTGRRKGNFDERAAAADELGHMGDERAVKPLVKALGDKDAHLRFHAADALAEIGGPAIEPLIKALGGKDENVRHSATQALGEMGDARAVEPLIKLLEDEDKDVRSNAAWALKKIGKPAVEPLVEALKDTESQAYGYVVCALVEMGARILPQLHELAFKHPECREDLKRIISEIASDAKRPSGTRQVSERPEDISGMIRSRALDAKPQKERVTGF